MIVLFVGITTCGTGFGAFVLAPLTKYLKDEIGWKGCNIILAGLCLFCSAFGATLKSRKPTDLVIEVISENNLRENKVPIKVQMLKLLQNKAFVMLMLANPTAVIGHYLIVAFLPGVYNK